MTMTLEETWQAVKAAPAKDRAGIIEAWLAGQPAELRPLMRPDLYSGLALLEPPCDIDPTRDD